MINKGQKNTNPKLKKHKKAQKSTKNTNPQKHAKVKRKTNQASSNTRTRRRKKGKRETEKEWFPVVSGVLCMGVGSAQFESCMKPGVRFMGLGAVPWIGW